MTSNPLRSVLLGTAVGDGIGLPAEGMTRMAIQRRWTGAWKHHFVCGCGMVSDDTEHTVFVAQSLIQHGGDVEKFQKALAWKLRWWLLCIPAGIGFATLRAILKLWFGFPPKYSGVFSAGNGPAMRSAIIGVFFAGQQNEIASHIRASTRLTHTDPKAETAALAVALTASWCMEHSEELPDSKIVELWRSIAPEDREWRSFMDAIEKSMEGEMSVADFASYVGWCRGVSGYAYHTVPLVLYAWWRHFGDYRATVESVIRCGGDADTTGAIVGALAALRGEIPEEWLSHLLDYPISKRYLEELGRHADAVLHGEKSVCPRLDWWIFPLRNFLFFLLVLVHGFRRLIPF